MPIALDNVTLFDWIQLWDWGKWKLQPRARPRVINYYPCYSNNTEGPAYGDYCRVKLMLYYLFQGWDDLLTVDNQAYRLYIDAFKACKCSYTYPEDFYTDLEADTDDESNKDLVEDATDETPLADFETFARRRLYEDFTCIDLSDNLGSREMDLQYDWSAYIGRYTIGTEVWDQIKAENWAVQEVTVDSSPGLLNTEQAKLYKIVVDQYTQELVLHNPRQLLLNVDSVAGSGKTFILLKICACIQELALAAGKPDPIFRAVPTGIAVFNIIGRTLYSLLQLPVKDRKADMSTATLQSLQALFQDCKFLIIDKKSMIDICMLSLIDDRLRAIFPDTSCLPFRGVNVLLYRDFFQLLPVGRRVLFSTVVTGIDAFKGQQLYRIFDKTVRLTQVMRQHRKDDISEKFRVALGELQASNLSKESWELLCTCIENQLSPTDVLQFDTALQLYFTTSKVKSRNDSMLAAANRPVKKINALNKGQNAAKATEEEADNLYSELHVCIGAWVMLTANL
jgi:ATP-dependent DNA helicase PIF1